MYAEVATPLEVVQANLPGWQVIEKERKEKRGRILVVDDENGPRQALRMLLKEEYEVFLASDVASALVILERESIDLVITDIRMPRQSGVDLLRIIKEQHPEIQVIILTGYAHLDTAMKAVEFGAFVYLEKPFDNNAMLTYVHAGLDKTRQERERRVMERLAIEANRFETFGRLVSGVMHDMGSPLSVIGATIEMMLDNPERTDATDRLKTMQAQVRHCSEMVRSAMNVLRQESRGKTMFSLNSVVNTCLEVGHPSMRTCGVTAHKELAPDLGSCLGDLVLVRQAVLNLIANACQAMKEWEEPRELFLRTWMEDGEACLAVEDTGPGIPEEHRECIFDAFFTTKGEQGTGLGLAVVRNAMKQHGGSVALLERPGRGATFVLRFPTVTLEEAVEAMRDNNVRTL
ncbi:MAG TPA: hybrid sensor histidine kinase/response regulator [Candidatus Hydrogenedentes bacterium]|nr:hybrid sensor histidine kinase/response regulator [Candidatus Hydrogenedentota bacterium]HPC17347.1 hybrid sensor histidine kinase/response regulator [Candidatus Hydrogenedentota bacterium]HRT20081.1 hybrid sensor histidine kinase/response regulator [Candidatus Hydrogenedentota bacterium]HRT64855.1 hybrid sensor histidine kinase/response regulator [Candidatus Hydrogenedentota bacterium]